MKGSVHGRTSVLVGVALTFTMRWTDRLIGFVSTLILARLLVPEDFGIIAMASIVVGLLELLDFGVNVALIQNRNAVQAHYDTAWTLRILQYSIIAIAIMIAAPLAADYFGDPRVVPVLRVMSIGLIISSLDNIGVVTFEKNMQFGLDFRFMFLRRIAGFFATIAAAWWLRSYWALVIGVLTGRVLGLILSYVLHPMRPRLSLEKFGEIFSVSQWMLLRNVGNYLDANLHKTFVGRRTGATLLGVYSLADQVAAMPSTEVLAPINRVLLPTFVEAKHNRQELKRIFLLAQGIQTLIAFPAGMALAMLAPEAVLLLLGEKWVAATPFVQLLALASIAQAVGTSCTYVMISVGQVKLIASLAWSRAAFFACAILLISSAGAMEIAAVRVLSWVLSLALSLLLTTYVLKNINLGEMMATVARPAVGAAVMAAAMYGSFMGATLPLLPTLVLKGALGIAVYAVVVILLWWLAGKPYGTESYVLGKLQEAMLRLRGKAT